MNEKVPACRKRVHMLFVNCSYGKKKHASALSRARLRHRVMTGFVACSTVVTASYFSGYVSGLWDGFGAILAIIGLITAVCAVLITVLDDARRGDGHATCCAAYTSLCEECRTLLAAIDDEVLDPKSIVTKIGRMTTRYGDVVKIASDYPTTKADYERAKEGIANGEEEYTDKEMSAAGI